MRRPLFSLLLLMPLGGLLGGCGDDEGMMPGNRVFEVATDSTVYAGDVISIRFLNLGDDTLYARSCSGDTVVEKRIDGTWTLLGAWYACRGPIMPAPLEPHSEQSFVPIGASHPGSWGEFSGTFRIRTRIYYDYELTRLLPDWQLVSRAFRVGEAP